MTAGAHDSGGGFGRSAGANVARGVMVIVGAVIVGLLLMNRGLEDTEADAGSEDGQATATTVDDGATPSSETTATTDDAGPTTTLGVPRDPSEVAVLVLNGTAGEDDQPLKGVAGRGTDLLKTNNYITRDPKNSATPGPSAVLYTEGFEAEAVAVATVLGVEDPSLVVQPFDPASAPVADIQEADIVVVIGNDGVIQV